jgi:8-oxo-dGTP diphosphatase
MKTIRVVAAVICDSMQPVKPLHTSEYDNEPLQRC